MGFTHIDSNGNVKMVDIGEKPTSLRLAKAGGKIFLNPQTISRIVEGNIKKGNVLTTAKIAAIMASKNTSNTIPLCHQIQLTSVDIEFVIGNDNIEVISSVGCIDKTGAEMEALHSVSVALLTIYDMCKAIDKNMSMGDIKLWEKSKQSV